MGRLIALLAAAAMFLAAGRSGAAVPFTTIERDAGGSSGYDARTTFVVRTSGRWRRVWQRLHAGRFPPPARPRVDFRRWTAIAVLRGPGTGVGLGIEGVERSGDGLRVSAVETRAGAGCIVPQVISKPYEVIRVARTARNVSTERVERVRSCER